MVGINFLNFKLYCKVVVMKTAGDWNKGKPSDIEYSETDPRYMIIFGEARNTKWNNGATSGARKLVT